jgi:O-antigen/teichoic acid export membrane protein
MPRPATLRHRGVSVAVAIGVMNVATYVYAVLAARVLGPRAFGAFASLMAVLIVLTVLQLGFQTTAARRIAADRTHGAQIEREVLGLTYRSAVVVGLALLLLTPVLKALLRLDSLATTSLVGLSAVPITIVGGQLGILQGERRWWPVAVVYLACGVPRLVIGTALILWHPTELAALSGVLLGSVVPVLLGAYALRHRRTPGSTSEHHATRPVIREIVTNSQALLAFLALMNSDVIVARNDLGEHDAGLYAGGLILTKTMLFLPQFVVVVAFPALATSGERRGALLRGLGLVLGLGIAGIAACAALPRLALVFVGGVQYGEIVGRLWQFAALGTALSLIQLLVYAVLARQGSRSALLVWAALVVVLVVGFQLSTLSHLLLLVVSVDTALFLALVTLTLTSDRAGPRLRWSSRASR